MTMHIYVVSGYWALATVNGGRAPYSLTEYTVRQRKIPYYENCAHMGKVDMQEGLRRHICMVLPPRKGV